MATPRLLLFVEDVEFSEFLHGELSGGDFFVERVFTRRQAIERLQAEDFPVFVGPVGWAKGTDPEIDELVELRKIFAMPAEGLARHPEPRALLPLLKKYVERQRVLDELFVRVLHHQAGLRVKEAKIRTPVDVPLNMEFMKIGEGKGRTVNLSPGGFFISLRPEEAMPNFEEEFHFEMTAPESRLSPLSGMARVKWLCDGSTGRTPPRGFFKSRIGFGAEIMPQALGMAGSKLKAA